MERLALITIILPFVGAFIVGLNKKHFAQIATVFAALATLGTLLVAGNGLPMAIKASLMTSSLLIKPRSLVSLLMQSVH